MSSMQKRVVNNSIAYTLVSILPFITAFITLPIYTRYIEPSDFGLIAIITTFGSLVGVSMSLQLNAALPRLYFDEDEIGVRQLFSTIFYSVTIIAGGFMIFISIAGDKIITLLFPSIENAYFPFFFIGLFTVFLSQLSMVINRLLVVQEKGSVVLKRTLVVQPIGLIIGIYLVAYLKLAVLGVLVSVLITTMITLLINIWVVRGYFVKVWDKRRFKESYIYSWPIIPHALGGYLFMYSDILVMEKYLPLAAIGIYAIADRFSQILKIIVNALGTALSPNFMRLAKDSEIGAVNSFNKIISLWLFFILTVWLFLSLFAAELVGLLTDEKYHEAYIYIPLLAAAYIFRGFYLFSSYPIYYTKNTKIIPKITLLAGLLNVVLNILLIPIIGIMAAVITTFLSNMLTAILAHYYSKKYFTMTYDWSYIAILIICYVSSYFLLINMSSGRLIFDVTIKMLGFFMVIAFVILLNPSGIRKDVLSIMKLFRSRI